MLGEFCNTKNNVSIRTKKIDFNSTFEKAGAVIRTYLMAGTRPKRNVILMRW